MFEKYPMLKVKYIVRYLNISCVNMIQLLCSIMCQSRRLLPSQFLFGSLQRRDTQDTRNVEAPQGTWNITFPSASLYYENGENTHV